MQRQQQLYDDVQQINEDSHDIVLRMARTVDKNVTMMLQDVTSQLSKLVVLVVLINTLFLFTNK